MASAQTMPSNIAHHNPATKLTICGVKYKPKAPPISHCPPLRSGVQLAVGPPSIVKPAVTSSGPIIHGKGIFKATHNKAAAHASSKVSKVRSTVR
jgi:hypothetical protein